MLRYPSSDKRPVIEHRYQKEKQDVEILDEKEERFRLVKKADKNRVVSIPDTDARHVHKSHKTYIDGYRSHIAIDQETELKTHLERKCLRCTNWRRTPFRCTRAIRIYGASGYSPGEFSRQLFEHGHIAVIKPPWQLKRD